MYRINIYPEYAERRAATQLRRVRSGVLMGLVTLEAFVVAALLSSGFLLAEQARNVKAAVNRLEERIASGPSQQDELAIAREMVAVRRNRLDWSPKLAAISQMIGSSLMVVRVTGEVSPRKEHRLIMEGKVRKGEPPLETVSVFLESLRSDDRVVADFPAITLGNIRGGDNEQFEVVCQTKSVTREKK